MERFRYAFLTILLVAIGIISLKPAFSQTYFFDNYSVKDGLGQSKVYSVIQDSEGYLWLGTESGVSQFDGISFRNYTTEDGLAENGVRTVCEDAEGNIWLGHTGGGISRIRNGKIEEWQDTLSINGDVTRIFQDKQQRLWIGTHGSGAVLITNPHEESIKSIDYKQFRGKQKLSDRVFDIVQLSDGNVYFIIDNAIKFFKEDSLTFDFYRLKDLSYFFQITAMFEDSHQNLWFGTYNNGLYKWDKTSGKFSFFDIKNGLSNNWISTISEDNEGNIWVGTWGGGISRFESNGEITIFDSDNGLKDNKIWCIENDREGNVLVGTNENGLMIYKGEAFVNYTTANGLINPQVWAVEQDRDGRYWFGTNDGITVINSVITTPGSITHYTYENKSLVSNQLRFIKEDKNGDIWIGTDGGVQQYFMEDGTFEYNFLVNSRFMRGNSLVTAMEIDRSNNLWVGTINGLIYYEIDNEMIAHLTQIHGLAGNDISVVYCDSKNVVWVGSRGQGLVTIRDTIFTPIDIGENITPTSIAEDSDGKIWIGTEGQGVMVYHDGQILKHYRTHDNSGLLADLITLIDTDENNNIYIGTNRGLNKYVQSEDKFYVFTEKIGFTGIEVKPNASYLDDEGFMWFGTVKGVTRYNSNIDKINTLEPKTHIKSFIVNFKEREMHNELVLNYQEKSIAFDYSSICLTDPSAVRYRVMLEGADNEWRPATNRTFVNFPSLPPGKYTFKVKACNNSGVWNKEAETFSFSIKPPFWQTPLFYIICAIVATAVIFTYIKIRERNLIREKNILEAKVRQRTAEVMQKNDELARKNKDITDSIRYAKRIQDAVLPNPDFIDNILQEYFIFWKPRDIVSGDFYWMTQKEKYLIITASDCTGHGVPGAFMSMLGVTFLNEIVNKAEIIQASEILESLRQNVIKSLKQTGKEGEAQDGMDMALCVINMETKELQYSGAYNPLVIIRNDEMIQFRADRMPIGIYTLKKKARFTNHTTQLQAGDILYMFSDGFPDQFGGENGGKFLSKNFKRLLLRIHNEPLNKQQEILEQTLAEWMGTEYEQLDDILVLGIKI